jgi:rhamnosyltransferase subunit B
VPFYADQLDNAARARKLGVARSVAPTLYNAASAAQDLRLLMSMPGYGLRAAHVGRVLAEEDGAARGAAIVLDRLTSRYLQ